MSNALRLALVTALFGAAGTADAKPRRVVVLDLEGKRALVDQAKAMVVNVLSESYELASTKAWVDAKSAAGRKVHGPATFTKAGRATGVDAVIDGWVQDEGRGQVLTLVITDTSNGEESDHLSIRLTGKGFDADLADKVRKGLDERLEWIDSMSGGNPDPLPTYKVKDKTKVGARPRQEESFEDDRANDDRDREPPRRRKRVDRDRLGDERREDREDREERRDRDRDERRRDRDRDREEEVSEKEPVRVARIEPKETKADKETNILASVFKPVSEEEDIVTGGKASHVPRPTPRFAVSGGFYYGSRTLYIGAENPDGVTQYAGVPSKGLGVEASYFPFPTKKIDGIQSGIGFSFGIGHSLGSVVTFPEDEVVSDLVINQSAWNTGIHYRAPLGSAFAITGSVGYGQSNYKIEDAPPTFEVPDTSYTYLSAGGSLDLAITERASVGFGAKYLYMLGAGDLSANEWYGPGGSAGWHLDGNFNIPLPANLFIKGELSYTRIKTNFDGGGTITDEEGVSEAVDSNVGINVKVGISF